MRVLLVQPPLAPSGPVEPPVGLAALAAWLVKLGHTPRILDLELEQRLGVAEGWQGCVIQVERVLEEFDPEVVGVTSMYSNSLQAGRVLAVSKAWRVDVPTLAGGSHFGALPRESLARLPNLDFVVIGEGEAPLSAFLAELAGRQNWDAVPSLAWRCGTEIIVNKPAPLMDLADLPNPWAILDGVLDTAPYLSTASAEAGRRVAYVEAGRGCPFACSFCATAPFWSRQFRVKAVTQIVEEMQLLNRAGYDRIVLVHDLLTVNPKFIRSLCAAILKAQLPVEWMANARTDLPLYGTLPLMKAAGCWKLFFGIESASDRIQANIDKHLNMNRSYETIADLTRHGLASTCSFVIGFPDETEAELSASLQAGARMKLLGAEIVQFHRLRIWPPAALSRQMMPRAFDAESLEIEYPYIGVPAPDLLEICSSPDFFGGYFPPETTAGTYQQISQFEMFAHHAVALAPMTIHALCSLRPGRFVSAFYQALISYGLLERRQLDWDGGALMRNWSALEPYFHALKSALDLSADELRLIDGLLAYEHERVRFVMTSPRPENGLDEQISFPSNINIPEVIRRIQADILIDVSLLHFTQIMFRRQANGTLSAYCAMPEDPATISVT